MSLFQHKIIYRKTHVGVLCCLLTCLYIFALSTCLLFAQTDEGEIEKRPAPVAHRKCTGGGNANHLVQ